LIIEGAQRVPPTHTLALLTFTEGAFATLDVPALSVRFKETIKRLRRRFDVGEYAAAVEFQDRGAMHPHTVVWWPRETAHLLRPALARKRNRDQYRWHFNEMVPFAQELGWGQMVDAEAIEHVGRTAHYATKSLASYVTKEASARFKQKGATRVRPFRKSPGWHPKTLSELRRPDKPEPGRWEVVQAMRGC